MEAMLNEASTLFLVCKFTINILLITLYLITAYQPPLTNYRGSCSKSKNSMDVYSIL